MRPRAQHEYSTRILLAYEFIFIIYRCQGAFCFMALLLQLVLEIVDAGTVVEAPTSVEEGTVPVGCNETVSNEGKYRRCARSGCRGPAKAITVIGCTWIGASACPFVFVLSTLGMMNGQTAKEAHGSGRGNGAEGCNGTLYTRHHRSFIMLYLP